MKYLCLGYFSIGGRERLTSMTRSESLPGVPSPALEVSSGEYWRSGRSVGWRSIAATVEKRSGDGPSGDSLSDDGRSGHMQSLVASTYRAESRRVLATLVRLLGDLDLAEEALQEAFRAALEQWPTSGLPANPRAWLVSTGRFKAIDALRRRLRIDYWDDERIAAISGTPAANSVMDRVEEHIPDDQLRLIFICCHPELSQDAQVALTLREVCDLTTEEIARAFLVRASTVAQRIVRAKATLRKKKVPEELPSPQELPRRIDAALRTIYLVFNEGYAASAGSSLIRTDLTGEAIRLGRLLVELLPDSEAYGLLALMLLQDSRRDARATDDGDIILLEHQDRSVWNRSQIEEGCELVERAFATDTVGGYTVQAAIAAEHARADEYAATRWNRIVALYDLLIRIEPSPIVELNRAVAVGMRDSAEDGLRLVEEILARGDLSDFHLLLAVRADLSRRAGLRPQARDSYRHALELARQEPQRRFLQRRLRELEQNP